MNPYLSLATASLEGHFDAPSFPIDNSQEKKAPIALEDLKTGPTLVLDFGANMNEIIEVHERDMDVVVQPGMPYELLNEELKGKGLFFPVDVSFSALIYVVGLVASVISLVDLVLTALPSVRSLVRELRSEEWWGQVVQGPTVSMPLGLGSVNFVLWLKVDLRSICSTAVRYGTMRENVLNLTVVLANGEVIKTRSRARKSSAGPDLTKIFIGSEGTMGLVVEGMPFPGTPNALEN